MGKTIWNITCDNDYMEEEKIRTLFLFQMDSDFCEKADRHFTK